MVLHLTLAAAPGLPAPAAAWIADHADAVCGLEAGNSAAPLADWLRGRLSGVAFTVAGRSLDFADRRGAPAGRRRRRRLCPGGRRFPVPGCSPAAAAGAGRGRGARRRPAVRPATRQFHCGPACLRTDDRGSVLVAAACDAGGDRPPRAAARRRIGQRHRLRRQAYPGRWCWRRGGPCGSATASCG